MYRFKATGRTVAKSLCLVGVLRGSCNPDHLAPGVEGGAACATVLTGDKAVATELEMGVAAAVG